MEWEGVRGQGVEWKGHEGGGTELAHTDGVILVLTQTHV